MMGQNPVARTIWEERLPFSFVLISSLDSLSLVASLSSLFSLSFPFLLLCSSRDSYDQAARVSTNNLSHLEIPALYSEDDENHDS